MFLKWNDENQNKIENKILLNFEKNEYQLYRRLT